MELGGLQRSATSYRRQGSSGLIWDDKLIAEFCNQAEEAGKMRRSHSAGSRGYRALKVASSPNVDPPSPKVSTCAFCGLFAKPSPSADGRRRRRQQQPQKQMKKTSKRT
ncbi:MAPK kinase substrate protein At1g80180 [Linum grandiflorum]